MFRKTIKFLPIRVDQFNRFAMLIHGCGQGLDPLTAADHHSRRSSVKQHPRQGTYTHMSTGKSKLTLHLNAIVSDAQLGEFLGISNAAVLARTLKKIPHKKFGHTKLVRVEDFWNSLEGSSNE